MYRWNFGFPHHSWRSIASTPASAWTNFRPFVVYLLRVPCKYAERLALHDTVIAKLCHMTSYEYHVTIMWSYDWHTPIMTMSFYGSLYDYIIHVELIATLRVTSALMPIMTTCTMWPWCDYHMTTRPLLGEWGGGGLEMRLYQVVTWLPSPGVGHHVEVMTSSDPCKRGAQLSLRFSCPIKEVHSFLEKHGVMVR